MLVNGIVTKILPCILFPLITVFLVTVLRKANKNRESLNKAKKTRSEKTSWLVIFLAVTFFVLEIPVGVATVLQTVYTDMGYTYIATYIVDYCNAFFMSSI
ncbi:hypothetical protein B9Z55_021116 [Caenorhabditis nigoni]|nr:hypothetical protein B9Z55_021116 [Caenorhabditis nigoni]